MGWGGYELYSGDGTFTLQLLLLEKAGVDKELIYESSNYHKPSLCPTCGAEKEVEEVQTYSDSSVITLTPKDKRIVVKAYPTLIKYLKPLPPKKYKTTSGYIFGGFDMEDWSIGWQMFADLIVNNKLPITRQIKKAVLLANEWLASEAHCGDFSEPKERRYYVNAFARSFNSYARKLTIARKKKRAKK